MSQIFFGHASNEHINLRQVDLRNYRTRIIGFWLLRIKTLDQGSKSRKNRARKIFISGEIF